jgi:hemolysin activation/secretion protein
MPTLNTPMTITTPAVERPTTPPPPTGPRSVDTIKIPIKAFQLVGVKAFTEREVLFILQDGVGKELTFSELALLVQKVTQYYREHGYPLARAFIPPQNIVNGKIQINVSEGELGQIEVSNPSGVAGSVIRDHLQPLQPGQPVSGPALERSVLLLNDLPGMEVRTTLKPGASSGTSDLDVQVQQKTGVHGSIGVDNFGSRYTGSNRLDLAANWNNPFGRGDVLSLRAVTSGAGMRYGRAGWELPLGGQGLKLGAALAAVDYRLGQDFASLNASGRATIASTWLSYPFVRSQATNLYGRLGYTGKRLHDAVQGAALLSDKRTQVVQLGLSGDHTDRVLGGGLTGLALNVWAGQLGLDSQAVALDQSASGYKTQGNFYKLTFELNRLQRLTDQWTFYGALFGQLASKNLDASEKFALGGATGVRAYPLGEAAGDDALLANFELRWTMPGQSGLQLFGFVDVGEARLNHAPLAGDQNNFQHLAAQGIGLRWIRQDDFAIQAYLAWRSGHKASSDTDVSPRAWLQGIKYF